MDEKRRRSRVLEYFEHKAEEKPETGGDDNPFRDFDSAFGLDIIDSKGDK